MPLFDATRRAKEVRSTPPAAAAAVVHAFLVRVQAYADDQVSTRTASRGAGPPDEEAERKLRAWESFARFNTITLAEIERGELDAWFAEMHERGE